MCNAARSIGWPTDPLIVLAIGLIRESTVESEQLSAPLALSRFCEMVLVSELVLSPPERIRFLRVLQSRPGSWALSSAATPVTCGVAIEVPLDDPELELSTHCA